MPTFIGKPTEFVDEFIFRAKRFTEGKCIDYTAASKHSQVVAILAANLREGAASWYHAQVVIDHIHFVDIEPLANALRREFVPPGQQFRLRADLKSCRQRNSVEEYVRDFRRLMAQIRQMSAMDHQAFERTHFHSSADRSRSGHANHRGSLQRATSDSPIPMDISAVDTRSISKEQCRRRNLCFYCKRGDRRINDCPVAKNLATLDIRETGKLGGRKWSVRRANYQFSTSNCPYGHYYHRDGRVVNVGDVGHSKETRRRRGLFSRQFVF